MTIPGVNGASVVLIEPAAGDAFDPATTVTYDGDATARLGAALTLAATLTGSDGPIAGAPLTFEFRGQTYGATTDATGRAIVGGVRTFGPPGTYETVVRYAGSDRYFGFADHVRYPIGTLNTSRTVSQT